MVLEKISKFILILFIVIFLGLLFIALGVKYQAPLNAWNNNVIKGEINQQYANLYLNNYAPEVVTWDLSDQIGKKVLTTNQYGNEVFLGGLITGAEVSDNQINVAFNSGTILKLSANGELKKKLIISPLLHNFILDKSNGGIRSVLWIEKDLIFVYYTSKNPLEKSFSIRASIVNTSNLTTVDDLELGQFSIEEHYALGGGGFYDKKNNRILLAIGVASGADNDKNNSKSQKDDSYFGKIVSIPLSNDKQKIHQPVIYSKGHRNSQGMTLHKNLIFSVEHGPKGGDEINIINESRNYGWNKFSYGTKYGKPDATYNNASNIFIEPIFYFTPSIGISDIYKCPIIFNDPGYKDCLLVSSMRDGSFYIAKLNEEMNRIQSIERVELGSRIRKIRSTNDSVFLFTDNQSIVKITYTKL